jgi:hypothetical protein
VQHSNDRVGFSELLWRTLHLSYSISDRYFLCRIEARTTNLLKEEQCIEWTTQHTVQRRIYTWHGMVTVKIIERLFGMLLNSIELGHFAWDVIRIPQSRCFPLVHSSVVQNHRFALLCNLQQTKKQKQQ